MRSAPGHRVWAVVDGGLEILIRPAGLHGGRLQLFAAAGNAPSNAVAVAAGFRRVGTQTGAEPLGDGTADDQHGYELLRATR